MLMCIFIAYRWKVYNMAEEIASGAPNFKGSFMQKFINVMIMYVAPILLAAVFLITIYEKFIAGLG